MAFSAGAVIIRVLPDMKSFEAGIHASTRTLGQRLGAMGAGLTRGLTVPIVAAGAASVKLAMDFESALGQIEGLVGISSKQVAAWGDDILDMSRDLPKGPQELAEALYFVASSGIAVKDAMSIVREAAKAASTGLGSTIDVADLLTSAVNVFGIENLSASAAADVLVAAVREGKGEADEYAEALGRVLPVADQVGASFDEAAAGAATLTLGGLDIYESVTALRQVFNSFIKPSVAGEKALVKVGTSITEVRDRIEKDGLIDTLIDLRDAIGEDDDALGDIFPNIRAMVGFLSLTGKNAEHNREVFQELAHATGDANDAFEVVSQTTEFKMKRALASIQATAIQFGQLLLPLVQGAAEWFGKLADFMGGLSDNTRETILTFAGLAAVIGPILLIVSRMLTPLGLIVTAIAGVGTIIARNWEDIGPIFQRVKDNIVVAFNNIKDAVGPMIDKFLDMLPTFRQIRKWAISAFNTVVDWVGKAADAFNKYLVPAFDWVMRTATSLWEFIGDDFLAVWDSLRDAWTNEIVPALGNMRDALVKIWPVIEGIAKVVGAVLAVFLKLALKGLPTVIRGITSLIEIGAWLVEAIATVAHHLGQDLADVGGFFMDLYRSVKSTFGDLVDFFRTVWHGIETVFVTIGNSIASAFEFMVNRIIDGINFLIRGFNHIPGVSIDELGHVTIAPLRVSWDNFVDDVPTGPATEGTGGGPGGKVGVGPALARGGIVTRPIVSLIGEAGPEAVLPLEKLGRMGGGDMYEIRITNWETGQGMARRIARDEVEDNEKYRERLTRFGRAR